MATLTTSELMRGLVALTRAKVGMATFSQVFDKNYLAENFLTSQNKLKPTN